MLKQPPQASLLTETTAKPFFTLPLIFSYANNNLSSMTFFAFCDFFNRASSSFSVSLTISSNSPCYYGYVGTGPGKITLYKEKTVVKKNVPESEAVDALIDLIKENGDWVDKSN